MGNGSPGGSRDRHFGESGSDRLEPDGARGFDQDGVARPYDLAELAESVVDVRDPAAGNTSLEVAARQLADCEQLIDAELGSSLAHLAVIRGTGAPELRHVPEDGDPPSLARTLRQVGEGGPH
jgi:hypothetical protein